MLPKAQMSLPFFYLPKRTHIFFSDMPIFSIPRPAHTKHPLVLGVGCHPREKVLAILCKPRFLDTAAKKATEESMDSTKGLIPMEIYFEWVFLWPLAVGFLESITKAARDGGLLPGAGSHIWCRVAKAFEGRRTASREKAGIQDVNSYRSEQEIQNTGRTKFEPGMIPRHNTTMSLCFHVMHSNHLFVLTDLPSDQCYSARQLILAMSNISSAAQKQPFGVLFVFCSGWRGGCRAIGQA